MEKSMLHTLAWVRMTGAYIIVFIAFFSSCSDETYVSASPEDSFVSVSGIAARSEEGIFDSEDYIIHTFRILAFDSSTGQCESNVLYFGAALAQDIRHPIKKGTYTFVFLANEPATVTGTSLAPLTSLKDVAAYSDLGSIYYPAEAFNSNLPIPMMREMKNIEVLDEGNIQAGGTAVSGVKVDLDRLATRVDVILKAEEEIIGESFTGVTFRNIPDKVPLMNVGYTSGRKSEERTFTLAAHAACFEKITTDLPWGMKINRIILPANVLDNPADEANAIEFAVQLNGYREEDPSCKLKIVKDGSDNNYSLPKNARLQLTATIKKLSEVNVTVTSYPIN